jgi:hypothetical protein
VSRASAEKRFLCPLFVFAPLYVDIDCPRGRLSNRSYSFTTAYLLLDRGVVIIEVGRQMF